MTIPNLARRSADVSYLRTTPPLRSPSPMHARVPSPMLAPPPLLGSYEGRHRSLSLIRPPSSLSMSTVDLQAILQACPKHEALLRLIKLWHTTIVADEAMKAKQCLFEIMQTPTYKNCYIELYQQDLSAGAKNLVRKVHEGADIELTHVKKQWEKSAVNTSRDQFQRSRNKDAYSRGVDAIEQPAKAQTSDEYISRSLKHMCVYDKSLSTEALVQKLRTIIFDDQFAKIYAQYKDKLQYDPKYGERFKILTTDADRIALLKQILLNEVSDYEFLKADYDIYDPTFKQRMRYFTGFFTNECLKGPQERAVKNPTTFSPQIALMTQLAGLYAALNTLVKTPIMYFSKICDMQPEEKKAVGFLNIESSTPRSFISRLVATHFMYAQCAPPAPLASLEIPETFEIEWTSADTKVRESRAFHVNSLKQISEDASSSIWSFAELYRINCIDACGLVSQIFERFEKLSPPLSDDLKNRLEMIRCVFQAQAVALETIIPREYNINLTQLNPV